MSKPTKKKKLTVEDVVAMEAVDDDDGDDRVLAAIWRHWEPSLRRVGGWTSATAFSTSSVILRDTVSHKVTGIYLSNHELKGSIPSEISKLSSLQELHLGHNQLTLISPELGALSSLQRLDLSDNQLTLVPSELGTLLSLQELYLSCNQLTSIPSELGALTSLQSLRLHYNQLTSIPAELGTLSSLQDLYLFHNQLALLPSELGKLSSLQKLYLSNNQLTSIPSELGTLSALEYLSLNHNCLLDMPSFQSSARIQADNQRLPTQLEPTFESWVNPSTPPDFTLFFTHDNEIPEEKVPIFVHLSLLTSRWKYVALLLDSGLTEIQTMQLDLSTVLSHRAGQCLVECFYGLPIDVTRLRSQDSAALIEHASELYLDQDPRLALLFKFCKNKIN